MRYIRFDSVSGASGDMILGALLALGADFEAVKDALESLLPGHFHLHFSPMQSCGISGWKFDVELGNDPHCHDHHHEHEHEHEHEHDHHHHHDHHHYGEIRELIASSALPAEAKADALAVFAMLAGAEGKVHGKAPDEVAFHEVGAVDSIVDIVGSALAFRQLGAAGISLSPVPVGYGTVHCAHGTLPVPAPATAELLKLGRFEVYPGSEAGELLTPTGAALLSFWPQCKAEPGRVLASGSGFGTRQLDHTPNLLRATLIECGEPAGAEPVIELSCNLDDCTGERLGALSEKLFALGALDVSFTGITMKKSRPGVRLDLLSPRHLQPLLAETVLRESGSFGVRWHEVRRLCLAREMIDVETPYGKIPVKIGRLHGEEITRKPEFSAVAAAAQTHHVSIAEVLTAVACAGKKDGR